MSNEQLKAALLERAKREKAKRQGVAQPEISTTEDVLKSLGSGAVRGAIGLAETPEMAGRALRRGFQEIKQLFGGEVEQETPIFNTATGQFLREATTLEDYQPRTTAGEYAGTVGEFLPAAIGGPAGLARRVGIATVAGLGSEAAGQATEGKEFEPYARIAGALIAPYTANKTLSALQKKKCNSADCTNIKGRKNRRL